MQIEAAVIQETMPNRPVANWDRPPFVLDTLTLADPRAGEVRVRLVASGVCHSDWHLVTGDTKHPLPAVAGHEGAGVIEAVGPNVSRVQPGDHVILNWAPDCGHCFYCLRHKPSLCETYLKTMWAGVMLDGTPRLSWRGQPAYHFCSLATFADHAVVSEQACVPIRRDVPLDMAVLVGCAVSTGLGAVLYTADVRMGDSVIVYGCGGVGLNILQGAKLAGAGTIIGVDTSPAKMKLATQFGATHTVLAGDARQTRGQLLELTGGRGADYVFEAIGNSQVQAEALRVVRPGGTLVLVGLSPVYEQTNLSGAFIARQEKVVKGCYYGSINTRRDFPKFLDMYMAGQIKLDELVSQRYRLSEINEAYAAMLSGDVARGVIVFE
ncbi:MAG: Zn-dependent alcohol dehydrogenase [Chloroflexota bacterium]